MSRSQSDEMHVPACGLTVPESQQEQEQNLYDLFLEMRDLLEAYAPAWYSDALRRRVEAIVQLNEK